jgi:hypothetical protein
MERNREIQAESLDSGAVRRPILSVGSRHKRPRRRPATDGDCFMRLSENKVDYLCHKIYQSLAKSDLCLWDRAEGPAVEAMKKIFFDDLHAEEDLEEEAHRILEEHMDEIRLKGADYHTMFKKSKALLARKRKMVL